MNIIFIRIPKIKLFQSFTFHHPKKFQSNMFIKKNNVNKYFYKNITTEFQFFTSVSNQKFSIIIIIRIIFKYNNHMKVNMPQNKCGLKCPDHTFSLKPYQNDLFFKHDTQIMYCYKHNIQSPAQENYVPQFNNDGKPHTPAFILSIDKLYYLQNDEKLQLEHNKKIIECEQKNQILFPKPSRKCKHCSVCKIYYNDYLEHIKQATHKNSIKSSKFNNHILDLCQDLFGNYNDKKLIIIDDLDSQSSQYIQKRNSFPSTEYQRPPYKRRHIQNNYFGCNQPNGFIRNNFFSNEMLHNHNLHQLWNNINQNNTNYTNNYYNANHIQQYYPYEHNYLPYLYNPNINLYNVYMIPQTYQLMPIPPMSIPYMHPFQHIPRIQQYFRSKMNNSQQQIKNPQNYNKRNKNLIIIDD